MSNKLYILLLILLAASCMPEENLPIRNAGKVPEYFIECYCTPGSPPALAITTVLPVASNLKIGYIRPRSVTIHAATDIDLENIIFSLPGSDFIYNYGTTVPLQTHGLDSLFLTIRTEEGQTITGVTSIPSPVRIYDYEINGNEVNIRFYPSPRAGENYYIYSAEIFSRDTLVEQVISYLDYSSYSATGVVSKSVSLPELKTGQNMRLTLKRITRANYDYQISLSAANTANQSSITTPVPLKGNLQHALGIFTCYTSDKVETDARHIKK